MDPQQKLVLHVGYLTFEQRHTQVSSLCAHHGGDFAMGIFVGVEPSGLQALERVGAAVGALCEHNDGIKRSVECTSSKANIGHLEASAAAASLTSLTLVHLGTSAVFGNTQLNSMPADVTLVESGDAKDSSLSSLARLSSFGFSGTIAHGALSSTLVYPITVAIEIANSLPNLPRDPSYQTMYQSLFFWQLTDRVMDGAWGDALHIEYNRDLFQASTAERFVLYFKTLVTSFVKAGDSDLVWKLNYLGEEERNTLLYSFNEMKPANSPLQNRHCTHLRDRQWNAVWLHDHMIGHAIPDMVVALQVSKSIEMAVAILGEASWFVMQGALTFSRKGNMTIISSVYLRQFSTTARHLVYVIYTSGSTGKPKGVLVEHAGVCLGVHGGTCVFLESGLSLIDLDDSLKFTILYDVPSVMALVTVPQNVALVQVIGEELSHSLVANLPVGVALWNWYGPTEVSIAATLKDGVTLSRLNSIGFPLENTVELLPIGSYGELLLGGVQIARGYLNRHELTAERFVPMPWPTAHSSRGIAYRTGDLARWWPNGELEFAGRIDFQVKIRGYRIELGEIEHALRSQTGVVEAVVVICATGESEGGLVAYLRPKNVASGCSSLGAVHLARRLSIELSMHLEPTLVFNYPTIEAIALLVQGGCPKVRQKVPRSTLCECRSICFVAKLQVHKPSDLDMLLICKLDASRVAPFLRWGCSPLHHVSYTVPSSMSYLEALSADPRFLAACLEFSLDLHCKHGYARGEGGSFFLLGSNFEETRAQVLGCAAPNGLSQRNLLESVKSVGAAIAALCVNSKSAQCSSSKSNLGHLEASAAAGGLVSLMLVALKMFMITGNAQLNQSTPMHPLATNTLRT
ncbi:hypothetical protein AURANDRAFT_67701 [Aureococcus anophagefferens]|uniref:AMP-dependent synthetase/ligase domain-containing protein n=1 Tax=Aureococcus anophagefferens TaxID=44056 RepID=F0YM39_AURAN|nr:hypothetical protein AURANDRAFT_67701 [Aureococcus anophagefferens]EGB03809.1 hypothetical protein AURANDRAFT_67701 [Aureococcus anophagefferens]|eukprot:XP_009041467.1 hypothetical protein AURANDRAFT_67701 [Aureococcus anophagefferens]